MNNYSSPSIPPPPLFPAAPPPPVQGFPESQFSAASTPSPMPQSQRPRFGFHAPSPYPRPRSSASKPNPGPYFNAIHEETTSVDNYQSPDSLGYSGSMNNRYSQNQSQHSSLGNQSFNDYSSYDDSYNSAQRSYNNGSFSGPSYNEQNSSTFPESYNKANFSNSKFNNNSYSSQDGDSSYATCSENSLTNYDLNLYNPVGTNQSKFSNKWGANSTPQNTNKWGNNSSSQNTNKWGNNSSLQNTNKWGANSTPQNTNKWEMNSSPQNTNKWEMNSSPQNTNKWGTNSPPQNTNTRGGTARGARRNFRGRFPALRGSSTPKFSPSGEQETPMESTGETQGFKRPLKRKAPAPQLNLRCDICGIGFTSQIPYEMHLKGAKHMKKMKAIETLRLLQAQGHAQPGDTENKIFDCKICNVQLNGALQVQTHFEGNKHKQKVKLLENPEKPEEEKQNGKQAVEEDRVTSEDPKPPVEMAPPAKMQKLSCDICGINVNSSVQLQQHLDSKKHQAKLEGKTLPARKGKGKKKAENADGDEASPNNNGPKVIDIPDINTTFVKAEEK